MAREIPLAAKLSVDPSNLAAELAEQFGTPIRLPDWETRRPKTYAQGARCHLNLGCRKVNTKHCDILNCQARSLNIATKKDENSF